MNFELNMIKANKNITLCSNNACRKRLRCYRFQADAAGDDHRILSFDADEKGCKHFVPVGNPERAEELADDKCLTLDF